MEVKDTFELAVQMAVITALGYDPDKADTPEKVRIGWQTEGQPGWEITENVVFVRGTPEDEPDVDRQVDINFRDANLDGKMTRVTEYQQVWRCLFTFYGPSAVEYAYKVRRAFVAAELHDPLSIALNNKGIYVVPDIAPPARVPEFFAGQWWERADMSAKFNMLISDEATDLSANSVAVEIVKENGLTTTVTAERPESEV